MAAYVVCLDKTDWEVLMKVLAQCGDGAILLSPAARESFLTAYGREPPDGELIDYDFGGGPNLMLDTIVCADQVEARTYAVDALLDHLGLDGLDPE